jgi:DNA-binding transcriptional LysR family regulator
VPGANAGTGGKVRATDVHQVRCFVTVAEEAHFGRAAERLHLTPSPVSRAVKELERELGAALFIRRYHQVELTPAGEQVLTAARVLLADFDALRDLAGAVSRRAPRVIHIGGTHLAPPALFDRVIGLAEELAGVRPVDIHVASSAELLPEVESGAIELALVHLPADRPGLDSLTLARYQFLVAMRSDDPLAAAGAVRLAEITDRTFAITSPKVHPLAMNRMHQYLADAGITKLHRLADNDTALLASYVRRGHSLALTLSPASGGASRVFDDPAFALVPLRDDGLEFTVGVAWRRDRAESDDDVAGLVRAVRRAWPDGPGLI